MVHQLMRNKGVREYWEASGRNLFAQDFVNEVDIILQDATNKRAEEPGPLLSYATRALNMILKCNRNNRNTL